MTSWEYYRSISLTGVDDESFQEPDCSTPTQEHPNTPLPWYYGVLNYEDFELIDPHRARFIKQLQKLIQAKNDVLSNSDLSDNMKKQKLNELTLENPPVKLEDLR